MCFSCLTHTLPYDATKCHTCPHDVAHERYRRMLRSIVFSAKVESSKRACLHGFDSFVLLSMSRLSGDGSTQERWARYANYFIF